MKRIVKLTERDLSRIVNRVINENEGKNGLTHAMEVVNNFLEDMGGTLGSRSPKEIMSDLEHLERAIKIEKNNLGVASERPNPRWDMNEMEEEQEVVVNVDDIAQEDMKCFSDTATPPGGRGRYKVKKRGCMTKTKYRGAKQKYSGNNWF